MFRARKHRIDFQVKSSLSNISGYYSATPFFATSCFLAKPPKPSRNIPSRTNSTGKTEQGWKYSKGNSALVAIQMAFPSPEPREKLPDLGRTVDVAIEVADEEAR
jgi:hypothetical protein